MQQKRCVSLVWHSSLVWIASYLAFLLRLNMFNRSRKAPDRSSCSANRKAAFWARMLSYPRRPRTQMPTATLNACINNVHAALYFKNCCAINAELLRKILFQHFKSLMALSFFKFLNKKLPSFVIHMCHKNLNPVPCVGFYLITYSPYWYRMMLLCRLSLSFPSLVYTNACNQSRMFRDGLVASCVWKFWSDIGSRWAIPEKKLVNQNFTVIK